MFKRAAKASANVVSVPAAGSGPARESQSFRATNRATFGRVVALVSRWSMMSGPSQFLVTPMKVFCVVSCHGAYNS